MRDGTDFYALTRYEDVVTAGKDWRTFSSRGGPMIDDTAITIDGKNTASFSLRAGPSRQIACAPVTARLPKPRPAIPVTRDVERLRVAAGQLSAYATVRNNPIPTVSRRSRRPGRVQM